MDESYHSLLAAGVEKKYRDLEVSIMEDVMRRIQKAGKITSAADWQIQRLMILGSTTEDIRAIVSRAVDGNEEQIRKLYEEVIANEYTSQKDIYTAVGREFIPYEQNAELQQITEALIRQSGEELYNVTMSTGFMVDIGAGRTVYTPLADIYNKYLDSAIIGMANGVYDYNTLIRRVTIMMTRSGLRTGYQFSDTRTDYGIDYASGWHNRIDVAARRALLTGFGQLAGRIADTNAQRLNTDLFEVTAHPAARPSHAVWQGRVWTRQELTDVCGLGSGGGLGGWNCRHSYYPFIEGISRRNYTDEELEEMAAKEAKTRLFRGKEYNAYQATQKQRQMETSMRAKRETVQLLRQAGVERDTITTAQCRYQAQLEEYRSFSRRMGLSTQTERVYTGRTPGRISPSPKVYQEYLHRLDTKRIDAILKDKAKALGFRGGVTSNVHPISVKGFTFDDAHINAERNHRVMRAEAERYIREAVIKVERWNGRFVNYYGPDGAAYVDTQRREIKTAFKFDEYDEKIIKLLEVLDGSN